MLRPSLSSCSVRQRIRPNVAFFYSQPVVGEEVADHLGLDLQILFPESSAERLISQGGVLDLLHENGNRL
jgi:hypothetical protein